MVETPGSCMVTPDTASATHMTRGLCVFFFQAEDGIRDLTVTGVQTCALPICSLLEEGCEKAVAHYLGFANVTDDNNQTVGWWPADGFDAARWELGDRSVRSEERRVGKEGRSRWSPYH